jgi:hypothetical protein
MTARITVNVGFFNWSKNTIEKRKGKEYRLDEKTLNIKYFQLQHHIQRHKKLTFCFSFTSSQK